MTTKNPNVFTTGEVAKFMNCSQQNVIRCIDRGLLKGYRLPGSSFRRVARSDLIDFLNANGMPLGELNGSPKE